MDFYINKLDWAIELLRDSEDMAKHAEGFDSLVREYKEIVKYAKSISVIDIHSEVKEVQKLQKNFIYVLCFENFDAFKIESL
ncbi:8128_t:CDS:1, partial [Gigaspora rosea]